MIYLLLSILCSSALSVVMRLSNGRIKTRTGMLAANYLTCMVAAFCCAGPSGFFSGAEGMSRTFGMGMLNGVFYASTMMANQYSIARIGIVLPSVFSRMGGLLVPLGFSVVMFAETPGVVQIAGSVLAIAGILLMNLKREGGGSGCIGALLVVLFGEGMASSMSKIYNEVGAAALSDYFLFFTFGSAFLLCAVVLFVRKERPGLAELGFGVMMGIPNFLATRLVLAALKNVPAIIVYPSRSVGTIAIVALVGVLVFGERLRKLQIIALPLIFASLIMLNL